MRLEPQSEIDALERQHDHEAQALFVAESDRLETLFRAEHRTYLALGLGWGSIAAIVGGLMSWGADRATSDPFLFEVRQFAGEYAWPATWHVFARAMEDK